MLTIRRIPFLPIVKNTVMIENKDQEILIEIIINKGEMRSDTFRYSSEARNEFAEKWGMKELFAKYDQLENDITWSDSWESTKRYSEQLGDVKNLIVEQAKECLRKEHFQVDELVNEMVEHQQRDSILRQLASYGIDEQNAVRLGLDNAEILENRGMEIRMSLPDTQERRDAFDREGFDYKAREGKLVLTLYFEAKRGVAMDDNERLRDFLQENGIEYIPLDRDKERDIIMAQNGRYSENGKRLFVPFTHGPANMRIPSRKIWKMLGAIGTVGAAAFLINPVGVVVLTLLVKKTMDITRISSLLPRRSGQKERRPVLTYAEKKALKAGEAIFYEDSRGRQMYVYMNRGNRCVMDARDLRLPAKVDGIALTSDELQRLSRGEMVALRKEGGEQIAVRVDPLAGDNLRRYYINVMQDRQLTAVPGRKSDEKLQLEYISQKGRKGIDEIFGTKPKDARRERFLLKYNLSELYRHKMEDIKDNEVAQRFDRRVRDVARLEYNKAALRNKGMKI